MVGLVAFCLPLLSTRTLPSKGITCANALLSPLFPYTDRKMKDFYQKKTKTFLSTTQRKEIKVKTWEFISH